VLLVESATTLTNFMSLSSMITRRRAWSFTSTLPFGNWRTAATEPMVSVLVASAAGSWRVVTFVVSVDGDTAAVA
jgi:hypothetical protein